MLISIVLNTSTLEEDRLICATVSSLESHEEGKPILKIFEKKNVTKSIYISLSERINESERR